MPMALPFDSTMIRYASKTSSTAKGYGSVRSGVQGAWKIVGGEIAYILGPCRTQWKLPVCQFALPMIGGALHDAQDPLSRTHHLGRRRSGCVQRKERSRDPLMGWTLDAESRKDKS